MENITITNIMSGVEFPGEPYDRPYTIRTDKWEDNVPSHFDGMNMARLKALDRHRKYLANLSLEEKNERRLKDRERCGIKRDCRIVLDRTLYRVSYAMQVHSQLQKRAERERAALKKKEKNRQIVMDRRIDKISKSVKGELPPQSDASQASDKTETSELRTEETNDFSDLIDSGYLAGQSVSEVVGVIQNRINRAKANARHRQYLTCSDPETSDERKRKGRERRAERDRHRKLCRKGARLQVEQKKNEEKIVSFCKQDAAPKPDDKKSMTSISAEKEKDQLYIWQGRLQAKLKENEAKPVSSFTQKHVVIAPKPEIEETISKNRLSCEGQKIEEDVECKCNIMCLNQENLEETKSEGGSQTSNQKIHKTYPAKRKSPITVAKLLAKQNRNEEKPVTSCKQNVSEKPDFEENISKDPFSYVGQQSGKNESRKNSTTFSNQENSEITTSDEDSLKRFEKTYKTYPAKKRDEITGAKMKGNQEEELEKIDTLWKQIIASNPEIIENTPKDHSSYEGQKVGGNENYKDCIVCLNGENLENTRSKENSLAFFEETYKTYTEQKRSTISEALLRANRVFNGGKTVTSCEQSISAIPEAEESILKKLLSNEKPNVGGNEEHKYTITCLNQENLEKTKSAKGCLTRFEKIYKIYSIPAAERITLTGASSKFNPPLEEFYLSEIEKEVSNQLPFIPKSTDCDEATEGPSTKSNVFIKTEPRSDAESAADVSNLNFGTAICSNEDPFGESESEENGQNFLPFVFIKTEPPAESEDCGGGSEKYLKETVCAPLEDLECIDIKEEFDADERFEEELSGARVHEEFNTDERINEALDFYERPKNERRKVEAHIRDTFRSGNKSDEVRQSTISSNNAKEERLSSFSFMSHIKQKSYVVSTSTSGNKSDKKRPSTISSNLVKEEGLSGFSFISCMKQKPYVVSTSTARTKRSIPSQTPISFPPRHDQLLSYYHLGEERLFFFTGIYRAKFKVLLSFLTRRKMDRLVVKCLPDEDQLLIFLFKYKHNRGYDYIGHLFGITERQVSHILTDVKNTFRASLHDLSHWSISKTQCNLQVIIECQEFISKITKTHHNSKGKRHGSILNQTS